MDNESIGRFINRRSLLVLGALVSFLVIGYFIYYYLSTGKITVSSTDKNAGVSISIVSTGDEEPKTIRGRGEVSARLKPGRYLLKAYTETNTADKTVDLKARQHIKASLDPPNAVEPEAVLPLAATDMIVSKDQLSMIDQSSGQLVGINGQSVAPAKLAISPENITSAQWISPVSAVVQDQTRALHKLEAGSLLAISLPFNLDKFTSYSLSNNGSLFVANGDTLYYSSQVGQSLEKIQSFDYDYLRLEAHDNKVAVAYNGNEDDEGVARGKVRPKLSIIDRSGNIVAAKYDESIYDMAWSASGKHLLTRGDKGFNVLSAKTQTIKSIPLNNAGPMVWISESEFAYAADNAVWRHSLNSGVSQKISESSTGDIEALAFDSNSNVVYFSSSSSDIDGYGHLYRARLDGKQAPSDLQILGIALPENVGECFISYSNFISPYILTVSSSQQIEQDCIDVAKVQLNEYNIDVSRFKFLYNPKPE